MTTPHRQTVEVHGYALRAIRQAKGIGVADLASATSVDRSYITHLENGTKRHVSPEMYATLIANLGLTDHRALLAVAPGRSA